MTTKKLTCEDCRWWSGIREHWRPDVGTCERITAAAGKRDNAARIYPVTSGAYLEVAFDFGCNLGEKAKS